MAVAITRVLDSKVTGMEKPGVGVDAQGGAVVDPTKNVLDLVAGEVKRLNDLRELEGKLTDAKLLHLKEVSEVRASHAKEIRELDVDRLEKIRQVDVTAANTAADRALAAIHALGRAQETAAETQRSVMATTATTMATQLEQQMEALISRIAAVEKSIYMGVGSGAGKTAMWGYVAGGVGILLTLVGIGIAAIVAFQ